MAEMYPTGFLKIMLAREVLHTVLKIPL